MNQIKLQTRPNLNGATRQLIIDTDKKTVQEGYFLFTEKSTAYFTITQLKTLKQQFINNNYREV